MGSTQRPARSHQVVTTPQSARTALMVATDRPLTYLPSQRDRR